MFLFRFRFKKLPPALDVLSSFSHYLFNSIPFIFQVLSRNSTLIPVHTIREMTHVQSHITYPVTHTQQKINKLISRKVLAQSAGSV